jgi:hypothetical protein
LKLHLERRRPHTALKECCAALCRPDDFTVAMLLEVPLTVIDFKNSVVAQVNQRKPKEMVKVLLLIAITISAKHEDSKWCMFPKKASCSFCTAIPPESIIYNQSVTSG